MQKVPDLFWRAAAAAAAALAAAGCEIGQGTEPRQWTVEVVAAYPHDRAAFTQGLAVHAGELYEGTGQEGASTLRRVDLATGRVERQRSLDARYFGEGIAILGERVYQLTWQNGVGFVYDLNTFEPLRTFTYSGEGWGLTHDGRRLILSDGTAILRFLDPDTLAVTGTVEVRDGERPLARLNELEYIDGEVWANIWYDDRIARIDPGSGRVLGYVDLAHVYPRAARTGDDVLNGIAWDAEAKRLFVTGKNWPQLFEVRVVPR